MRNLALVLFGIFFSSSLVSRGTSNGDGIDQFARTINELKNPKYYAFMQLLLPQYEEVGDFLFFTARDDDFTSFSMFYFSLGSLGYNESTKGKQVFMEFLKETLLEGAKPTEDKIVKLAKRYSKILRDIPTGYKNIAYRPVLMREPLWPTTDVLGNILAENQIQLTGNNFLKIFQKKNSQIFETARAVQSRLGIAQEPDAEETALSFTLYALMFTYDEFLAHFQSEENAIEGFKDFAEVAKALKDPASYASPAAFKTAMSQNKNFKAILTILVEMIKCAEQPLTPEEREALDQILDNFVDYAKVLFPDGEKIKPENIRKMNEKLEAKYPALTSGTLKKMTDLFETEEGVGKFKKCFLNDNDNQIMKQLYESSVQTFTDEKLSEVAAGNKKVCALAHLINKFVTRSHRRIGLSDAAAAYFKQFSTTPHLALWLSNAVSPSDESRSKIQKVRKELIEKFNALNAETKKEIGKKFPYRTLLFLSSL